MDGPNDGKSLKQYPLSVVLKDGSVLRLRPIQRDDQKRMLDLFYRLSTHTVYLRFHHVVKHMSEEEVKRFCTVDYDSSFALVGMVREGDEEKIVAVGRYSRLERTDRAEVGFLVEDAYQGKGIGTHLLQQLAEVARKRGIDIFEAEVLAENREMMKVLRDSGYDITEDIEAGTYKVSFSVLPTSQAEDRMLERQKTAAIASLKTFLEPRSVAVVGASRKVNSIGHKTFRNILNQGFQGVVYPVNPQAEVVASVKAYRSILDVPGEVDLALIVVPAAAVNEVVEECGRKGVRGVVVISAGFAEMGAEGVERQQQLVQTASGYGMRVVGPNCMGVINTNEQVSLNATFSSSFPPAGRIAFCTQSGALGLAILEYARSLNIGLSTFVSIGNRADVSNNDLVRYWEEDPATDVILLYVESFGEGGAFSRIARRVAGKKPIVVVKGGRTSAGTRAAASHTGALATAGVALEALFQQSGIIPVDTLEELFDVAEVLANQPVPQGRRVVILTNGGGPGILAADACAARGLELPLMPEDVQAKLKDLLPGAAGVGNPVDMTAEATGQDYRSTLEFLAQQEFADIVVVIFIPPVVIQPEVVASAIKQMSPLFRERGKTLLASFMSSRGAPLELGSESEGYVPSFAFPEAAAAALSRVYRYGEWLRQPRGVIPEIESCNKDKAESIINSAFERTRARPLWLDARSVAGLLSCYGIDVAGSRFAATRQEAAQAAGEMGFPVAVKLASSTITHKTEVDGVVLDLRTTAEVENAFEGIERRLKDRERHDEMDGVVVQKMISGGVEVIVGVTQDPSFGSLILFGMGGIYTELFQDVTFRIHPLTDVDARNMVRSVKAYQLLEGWRGSAPSDIESVEQLLLRISAMVEDLPSIEEIDLNPVKVFGKGQGCVVVDARVALS